MGQSCVKAGICVRHSSRLLVYSPHISLHYPTNQEGHIFLFVALRFTYQEIFRAAMGKNNWKPCSTTNLWPKNSGHKFSEPIHTDSQCEYFCQCNIHAQMGTTVVYDIGHSLRNEACYIVWPNCHFFI